jgi:hypothetical protein
MSDFSQLLEEYAAVAVYIDAKEAEIADIKKVRDNIKAAVQAAMCEMGITNGKTIDGHAVTLVKNLSTKVEDADAFYGFVFSDQGGETFLTKHVSKEAVDAYMDEHEGTPPPGIKVETVNSIRFTKAKVK